MAVEPKLSDQEIASLLEIPHPSKGLAESIYGGDEGLPDYQADPARLSSRQPAQRAADVVR